MLMEEPDICVDVLKPDYTMRTGRVAHKRVIFIFSQASVLFQCTLTGKHYCCRQSLQRQLNVSCDKHFVFHWLKWQTIAISKLCFHSLYVQAVKISFSYTCFCIHVAFLFRYGFKRHAELDPKLHYCYYTHSFKYTVP